MKKQIRKNRVHDHTWMEPVRSSKPVGETKIPEPARIEKTIKECFLLFLPSKEKQILDCALVLFDPSFE